jgi:hypothetical protein
VKAKEFLIERLSSVVYHYSSIYSARSILQSGKFELSSTLGSIEQQYAPKGYPYFLSTTRTRHGGYHKNVLGYSGVLFVLDGTWYNRHYKAASVDYWQERGNLSPGRSSEAEDRIFSKDPTISIKGVTEVHVYLKNDKDTTDAMKARTRQVLILAKKLGIPAYFYNDAQAWLNFDKRRLGDMSMLTGQDYVSGRVSTHKGYLMPWVELIFAKDKSQLSKDASRITGGFYYSYDKQNITQGLANELSNSRKPNSGIDREHAVKIINFMRQNKLATVGELVEYLTNKWTDKK